MRDGGVISGGLMPMTSQGAVVYWPYPSPPVSPYATLQQQQQAQVQQQAVAAQQAQVQQQQQQQQQMHTLMQQAAMAANPPVTPTLVLMRGLPANVSVTDILNFFQGYRDVSTTLV